MKLPLAVPLVCASMLFGSCSARPVEPDSEPEPEPSPSPSPSDEQWCRHVTQLTYDALDNSGDLAPTDLEGCRRGMSTIQSQLDGDWMTFKRCVMAADDLGGVDQCAPEIQRKQEAASAARTARNNPPPPDHDMTEYGRAVPPGTAVKGDGFRVRATIDLRRAKVVTPGAIGLARVADGEHAWTFAAERVATAPDDCEAWAKEQLGTFPDGYELLESRQAHRGGGLFFPPDGLAATCHLSARRYPEGDIARRADWIRMVVLGNGKRHVVVRLGGTNDGDGSTQTLALFATIEF